MPGIKGVANLFLLAVLAILACLAALPNRAVAERPISLPTTCAQLPAKLLGGNIKYANAQIVPANTAPGPQFNNFTGTPPSSVKVPVAYCLVVLSYSSTPANDPTPQNITVYVGLPLNSLDGGTTGSTIDAPFNFATVEGNWNGRTEGQGGGGCTGNTNVNSAGAVANGFVGSGTDGGHGNPTNDPNNTCQQGVLSLGHLNKQYIDDWVYSGPQQEILWSKRVARLYYGKAPLYNYWNGCSTGGHQGFALAQTLAGELDGILANAPAMYWTRFQTAQMWGQIAMFDIAGGVIAGGKLAAVQNAAIAACDKNDRVQDGIIDDPRTCTFNAKANICGQAGAPAAPNCLTPAEANAVNVMWDGPRNDSGKRIWFPIDRGTDFNFWDGNVPFGLAPVQFGWDLANPAYYNAGSFPGNYPGFWGNVALNSATQPAGAVTTYAAVAQAGSNSVADRTDTFDDLDAFKASGGKMITVLGTNDGLIMPRGVINYYRVMARRYAERGDHDRFADADDLEGFRHDPSGRFRGIQKFYRLFRAPGVSHCGLGILNHGSLGPWPQGGADFNAVINWVEHGVAPSQVIGSGNTAAPAFISGSPTTLTRPLCPYPQTAVYNGSGNVNDAANWHCDGDMEKNTPVGAPLSGPPGLPVACYDVLVKYKHEVNGPLDFEGSGVDPASCHVPGP
ncbi:tannase/feruloyl esterase family alpha/beta hydrolase [Bradyrhizobium sp. HKCCYLS1011]|uniref:tannase/feruloyl esterase family alpha/beta hydrolase n=1 Tax=Bradyrhizobium sp. HKCCYLS1011 TaxID=3420733 RepID=UPI003EBC8708